MQNYPDLKGFTRRGLYRMKQFYEVYRDDEKVTTLLTQLSWTNHLKIMSGSKSPEERRFYIELAIKEKYSKRKLEKQCILAIMNAICFLMVKIHRLCKKQNTKHIICF